MFDTVTMLIDLMPGFGDAWPTVQRRPVSSTISLQRPGQYVHQPLDFAILTRDPVYQRGVGC